MSVESAKQYLEDKIAALSAEIERLRTVRESLDDKKLVELLFVNGTSATATDTKPKTAAKVSSNGTASTNAEQVINFMKAAGDWVAAPDIVKGTGLDRGIVSNLLYVASAEQFESKDHPTLNRRKLWRLKPRSDSE